METQEKKKTKKTKLSTIIAVILIIAGLAVLAYPAIGNYISYARQNGVVSEYEQELSGLSSGEIEKEKELAEKYNETLRTGKIKDPFKETTPESQDDTEDDYFSILSTRSGVMGYIDIPEIKVSCPIYKTTTGAVLQKGVGHLKGTSLPVGGEGTHCVLTGHTGIPGNMLFTDLDKLKKGDEFYLHVFNDVLAYKVDQIKVVEPDDTKDLMIVKNRDYCTLLTCTPYGVNSHRLLVRGVRTTYTGQENESEAEMVITTDVEGNVVVETIPATSSENNSSATEGSVPLWAIILCGVDAVGLIVIGVIVIKRIRKRRSGD